MERDMNRRSSLTYAGSILHTMNCFLQYWAIADHRSCIDGESTNPGPIYQVRMRTERHATFDQAVTADDDRFCRNVRELGGPDTSSGLDTAP